MKYVMYTINNVFTMDVTYTFVQLYTNSITVLDMSAHQTIVKNVVKTR